MSQPSEESRKLAAEIMDLVCDEGPAVAIWIIDAYVPAVDHIASLIDLRCESWRASFAKKDADLQEAKRTIAILRSASKSA